jgi:putative membrane protein
MQIAKLVHVLGNILWLGGGAACAFTMLFLAAESKEVKLAAAKAVRKLVLLVVTPGMLLSFAGGLTNLLMYWDALYKKAPWMHTKLLVGLIAAAITGVLSGKLRKAASGGPEVPAGAMKLAGSVLLVSALLGVALVVMRFGSAG